MLLQEVQKSGKGEGRVFFAELEFKESQALFHRLAANSLPWIVHVSGALNIGSDGPLKIKHEDVVSLSLHIKLPRLSCRGKAAMMACFSNVLHFIVNDIALIHRRGK